VEGAYGSGSHRTGFKGLLASAALPAEELDGWLTGKSSANHDFSPALKDEQKAALVAFIQEGLVDTSNFINPDKTVKGDQVKGKVLFESGCAACHGSDGKTLNFGSAEAPEYVGTLAADNPWEFLHKVRFGQPGTAMPAAVDAGWTLEDMANVLAHSQTLPVGN
jgi:thiosulfate dehydrogenase